MVLMKGLMDSVDVDSGDDGTTVRLARRLEARRLSAHPDLRLADRGSVPVAHIGGELDLSSTGDAEGSPARGGGRTRTWAS